MKSRVQVSVGEIQMSANEQVRREIQVFVQALSTYPERFARNPRMTFAEYCTTLREDAKSAPRRRD